MEHHIDFQFQARYETLGAAPEHAEELWFVCHGQGQLAKYFIRKFKPLDNGKRFIVAPEGLFRYYLQGFSGRVGATWMTKEDRQTDIENYLTYLSAVFNQVKSQMNANAKVTLLGFSQGAATISRFATQTPLEFHKLVLWAGIFPPDLPPLESRKRLSDKPCFLVYGKQDPFLTEKRIQEQQSIAEKISVQPQVHTFEGEHVIDSEVLIKIGQI